MEKKKAENKAKEKKAKKNDKYKVYRGGNKTANKTKEVS